MISDLELQEKQETVGQVTYNNIKLAHLDYACYPDKNT